MYVAYFVLNTCTCRTKNIYFCCSRSSGTYKRIADYRYIFRSLLLLDSVHHCISIKMFYCYNLILLSFGRTFDAVADNNRFSIMKSKHLLMTFLLYVKIIFGPLLIDRVALCASVQDNVLISSCWCLIMIVLLLDRGVHVNEKSRKIYNIQPDKVPTI